jgi:hypothetical protein
VHGASGRLFTIAQGGIEEDDLVWITHSCSHFRNLALS